MFLPECADSFADIFTWLLPLSFCLNMVILYTQFKIGGSGMAEDKVYIDFADGMKRVMNNSKLYIKLLSKFRNDTRLDDLEAAVKAGDLEKAKNAAHTIKGLSANLSLTELNKQSLALETQLKAGTADLAQLETVKAAFAKTDRKSVV
jgi:HPt (histidine-containing phosphotransfer) domain-containing protein